MWVVVFCPKAQSCQASHQHFPPPGSAQAVTRAPSAAAEADREILFLFTGGETEAGSLCGSVAQTKSWSQSQDQLISNTAGRIHVRVAVYMCMYEKQ